MMHSVRRKSKSRGFTLVEVVVMSAVGLMLFGIAYSFFVSSARDSSKTSKKLQALQSSVLFLERFQSDVRQAFYLRGKYEPKVIYTDGKPQGFSFYKLQSDSFPPTKDEPLKLKKYTCTFSPVTSQIYINNKPFGVGHFKYVEFNYEKGNPTASPPVFADTVTVNVVSVPDEDLSKNLSDIDKRNVSNQVATFCLRQQAYARFYHNWVFYQPLVELED